MFTKQQREQAKEYHKKFIMAEYKTTPPPADEFEKVLAQAMEYNWDADDCPYPEHLSLMLSTRADAIFELFHEHDNDALPHAVIAYVRQNGNRYAHQKMMEQITAAIR